MSEKANFEYIKVDNRLNKSEINEVKELAKNEEQMKILLDTNKEIKDFIDSEYRWANENYLAKNGKTVKDLQKQLGFEGKDIDGGFGKQTFQAVIKFQKENGLVVDGLVGDKTQAKLFGEKEFTNSKVSNYFRIKSNREIVNDAISKYNYENGLKSMFTSEPYEKRGGMTYCSKTARKNLYNLGVPYNNVPRGPSAIASMNMYDSKLNYANNITNIPEDFNVLDIYVDTASRYEHRAAAYLNNGEWYVLDPYSKTFKNTTNPIPLNNYMAYNKIMGAFPHSV